MASILDSIDIVVVVIMENRSFDHMLGYLSHPDFGKRTDVDGLKDTVAMAPFVNPYLGRNYPSFRMTQLALTGDPPHERRDMSVQIAAGYPGGPAAMTGFVANYASNPGVHSEAYGEVMGFFTPEEVPVTAFLANNFVICDRWFSSLPASTQPNRLMAMGGYSETDNTFGDSVPNQDLVYDWCDRQSTPVRWRVYHEGWPFFMVMPRWRLKIVADAVAQERFRYLDHLEADFSSSDPFPQVVFIEPKYTDDHFSPPPPSDDHPPSSAAGGQIFLRKIYLALRKNKARWNRTLMIVIYDENGGFFDHVAPIPLKTTDPTFHYEPFVTSGLRVPALIVSPLIDKAKVFSDPLDHTSILKLIGKKFGDRGIYSAQVANRTGVESVADILNKLGLNTPRTDDPRPPDYCPALIADAPRDRPDNLNSRAFEQALIQMRKEQPEEAARKFPEVADYLSRPRGLFWPILQRELAAKSFSLEPECQYLLRDFVELGEVKLLKDPSRQVVAVRNLVQFGNAMMADALRSGTKILREDNFYTAEKICPLWPFC